MSHYGKRPRLSLEEGVNFQNPVETDEVVFPVVPTPEKEEREGEEEVQKKEEEDSNKQKEEDNIEKEEEDDEAKEEDNIEKEEDEAKEEEEEKEESDDTVNETEEEEDITSMFLSNVALADFSPPSPSPSSASSSSFSSSSSSSSFFSLLQSSLAENDDFAVGLLGIFQNAQSFFPLPTLGENLDEAVGHQEESSGVIPFPAGPGSLLDTIIHEKATDLVFLFIYKYRMKEPITLTEIYEVITKDYEDHFPVIFIEASKCLEMTFGIDIKESDLVSNAYVFVNSLNLTYEDVLGDSASLPRNAFLIVILGVIFIEGNCASEERIWEFLKLVGVYDGEEHFICGDPREFLTVDLVQQNYLVYREVPNSQPPCFEFLWGPRANAETTKMKVLEFLAKMNGCDLSDFSVWYEEALRDEEERAWALNDSANASPNAWFVDR